MKNSILVQGAENPTAVKWDDSKVTVEVNGQVQTITAEMEELFIQALSAHAAGQAVALSSDTTLVTTQQAADFIGVSRPTLIKLLGEFETPLLTTGKHRRIRFSDLLILEDQLRDKREKTLRELIVISEQSGLDALTNDGFNPLVKN